MKPAVAALTAILVNTIAEPAVSSVLLALAEIVRTGATTVVEIDVLIVA